MSKPKTFVIGGVSFEEGEIVSFEVEKGAPRDFIVVDKSKDNLPGLVLRNITNKREFAINSASVATKIKKIPQPEKIVPPEETYSSLSGNSPVSAGSGPSPYVSNPAPKGPGRLGRMWNRVKPIGGKIKDTHEALGGSSRLMFELLILFAIGVHVIDAYYLKFSISSAAIGYRTIMYFFLCAFAHFVLNKGWSAKDSIIELLKISAIPVFIVPFISIILGWFTVPDVVVSTISGVTLAVPIWLFYIMYVRGGKEATAAEGNGWVKLINLLFTPSGWAKIWFFILILAVVYSLINTLGVTASSIPGAGASGFDVKVSTQAVTDFLTTTYGKMATSASTFFKGLTHGFNDLKNQTMGEYYTGQVEQNKEVTGIFITEFHVDGKQYDSMPIMAYGYIHARSFVEGITIKTSCYAQSVTNKSQIYQGTTDPDSLDNIYIEDQRGVLCTLKDNANSGEGLPAGRYQVFLVLEFNFETWAYKQYYFMDRNYIVYLKTSGENPNTKLGIPQKTTTVYTNGPVMIGMDDKVEMPFALSTDNINYLPIGMTIDNKPPAYGAKGEVVRVNKYTLRLPNALKINTLADSLNTPACTIKSVSETPDNLSGYTLYTFNIPENSLAGTYMTLNCNLKMDKESVQDIIPGANTPAIVSVIGTVAYDYKLSKMIPVTVEKTPGT